MQLWLRDHPGRDAVGALPEGVELHLIPREGLLPDEISEAEFLVPAHESRLLELLPRMRSLRVIQTMSAGVDWLLPSVPPGVTVCSARGTRDIPVAEWVIAALLSALKEFPRFWRQQTEGRWESSSLGELAGRRVLIVGYGSIGRAVESRLLPFGVELMRVGRVAGVGVHGVDELRELLPEADIVIVLVPQTSATTGLFDAEMLACLKDGALLVNAARGGVLDTAALLQELEAERIRAALDVTDPEPLPGDHLLWNAPGVLLTPHLAGASQAAERRAFRFAGEQVRRYVSGEPLINVVSRDD